MCVACAWADVDAAWEQKNSKPQNACRRYTLCQAAKLRAFSILEAEMPIFQLSIIFGVHARPGTLHAHKTVARFARGWAMLHR